MSRLRSLDSKISFFAFADIITSVSGVLIFVALLLATDLGRPVSNRSAAAKTELERKLEETLAQQVQADAQNGRLQELLATATTAPDADKLKADVARLEAQLADEQKKQAALAGQMAGSQAALAARDKALGLTDLSATVKNTAEQADSVTRREARDRSEMESLEQQVARTEAQLLKLRQFENQVWLVPDKTLTTKEPIVVFVNETGAAVQRLDHPDQTTKIPPVDGDRYFKEYLKKANPQNQYVVFEIKPSGIELFRTLVGVAREMGFDVGYDALEEGKNPHLTAPPSIDESVPPTNATARPPATNAVAVQNAGGRTGAVPPAASTAPGHPSTTSNPAPPAPPKTKSWWQKLLEWIGLG
jgi:hypothetical protein